MTESVQQLAALQDIDGMIRETPAEEKIGFSTSGRDDLEKAREKLASRIEPKTLRLYERLRKRYDRAVVPVIDHKCVGCSMAVPTAHRRSGEDRTKAGMTVCQSCGRILFFV